jgi:superfamily I DNA/RNA helicase
MLHEAPTRRHGRVVLFMHSCAVAGTNRLVQDFGQRLRSAVLDPYEVKRGASEQRDRAGVGIATMHRVKGLEFEDVIVVSANDEVVPLSEALAEADDSILARDAETAERALPYVALTRAKRSALITGCGKLSGFLA